MPSINFPPPVRLPPPIIAPTNPIDLPTFDMPKWEPIPIYRDQVPGIGNVNESDDEDQTKEETKEEETEKQSETKPEQAPIKPPTVELPSFPPINLPVPPSPEEIIPETGMVNEVTIPIINIDVPLPKTEIVVIAVTTAGVAAIASVGGTMVANQTFRQLIKVFKPLIKTILKKLMKMRGKTLPSWSRERRSQKYQRVKGPTK